MNPSFRRWLTPVILILVALAVYRQVLDHQFTAWDDHGYIDRNPYILRGFEWTSLKWAFTSGSHSNYHPLTWLSHMLDIELFGLWAGGHALTNLLLHTLNSLLLWRLVRTLTGRAGVALFVALLFVVHPLNVEAVANISQRKSVLATCFGLLALLAYVGYAQRGGLWRYGFTLLFATLSLLAKSLFVTLPCLFLLLDYWPLRRTPWCRFEPTENAVPAEGRVSWARLLTEKAPFCALSIAIGLLTVHFQKGTGAMDTADVDRLTSLTGAVASYVFYLQKTVWPFGLAAFYPLPERYAGYVLPTSLAILFAVTSTCVALHRKHPHLLFGWSWFCIVLFPMAGFVRVGGMAAADRYCYVPLVGLFLAVGLFGGRVYDVWAARHTGAKSIFLVGTGIVVLGLAAIAHRQVGFWNDTENSFNRILAIQGPHDLFPALIGYDLFDRGEFARAIPYFRQSLEVMPNNAWVAVNLGIALHCTGNSVEAEYWLRRALSQNRRNPGALNTLAKISEAKGDYLAAIALYREVLQITPSFLEARISSARLLMAEGRPSEAADLIQEGIELYPNDSTLRTLKAQSRNPPSEQAPAELQSR